MYSAENNSTAHLERGEMAANALVYALQNINVTHNAHSLNHFVILE